MPNIHEFPSRAEGLSGGGTKEKSLEVRELEDATRHFDLNGVPRETEEEFDFKLREAKELVANDLKELAALAHEMKKGGYNVRVDNVPYNERDMIPGSIGVWLEKDGAIGTIYEQRFGISFLGDFRGKERKAKDWLQIISQAKGKMEKQAGLEAAA